ncbi:helix-turn-helix domain-containing protein [Streptomyces sp. NBC_00365]|uniref:helix-turn-helix domain-containing protein n=1 Tax=Streptomyces sp. NBC_00365 TaxID=2975726 RepID=UPI0022595E17|nr:helix-turn-helix transcriptional regulator [Streptomyces sp. NBC_00365]MCX5090920.1 helix-turn-helix domain-containing protein [Streptomyces sp. NBC_00365]
MSKRALAQAMDFDSSYVSHMESGRHKPCGDFARLADEALNAGKAIWRRWALRRFRRRATCVPRRAKPADKTSAVIKGEPTSHEVDRIRKVPHGDEIA